MKYAVVRIGGRQFRVEEGQNLTVDRLDGGAKRATPSAASAKEGEIDEVLLLVDGDEVRIGRPLVSGVKVKTKVLEEGVVKTEIRRFKAKSRYRKKKGHKQPVTTIRIEDIEYQ